MPGMDGKTIKTLLRAAGLTALVLAAVPATAAAATVGLDGDALVYRAAPGEANRVLMQDGYPDASKLRFEDQAPIAAGPGCTTLDATTVECTVAARVRVELGDGHDSVSSYNTLSHDALYELIGGDGDDALGGYADADLREDLQGGAGKDSLRGYGGADRLAGGAGDDTLQGDGGADVLLGEDGNDTLRGDHQAAPAPDVIDGGPGSDKLEDFTEYGTDLHPPAAVSLDGVANDGRAGEGDNVTSIERHIAYVSGTHVLSDGAEEWQIWANLDGGASSVHARGGDDTITGADAAETIDGGAGNDRIEGGKGHDTLVGGPGADVIYGDETTSSCRPEFPESCVRYGNDTIDARDGEIDQVDCGAGIDTVRADAADVVSATCETVDRGSGTGPGGGPGHAGPAVVLVKRVGLAKALRKGMLVRLTGAAPGRVTLVARVGRRVVARGAGRVSAAGRATIRLRFTKAGRRAARGKRKLRLVVRGGGVSTTITVSR